jgi:hypothetical protein
MEEKSTLWKSGLTHGLITGLALIIYSVLLFVLELNLKSGLNYLAYLIIIAGFIYGTKTYRDNALNGSITYSKALGYSTVILLVAAILSTIYNYVFFTIIDPDIVDKILAVSEEKMLSRGMSDEQIEMGIEMSKKFMSPVLMTIMGFIWTMIFGFILALITSAFIKKDDDSFQNAMQDIKEEE